MHRTLQKRVGSRLRKLHTFKQIVQKVIIDLTRDILLENYLHGKSQNQNMLLKNKKLLSNIF